MRRIAKIDANQPAIVRVAEGMGCKVQSIATVGGGVPDIIIGMEDAHYVPVNLLIEVKDGSKPPSDRKLTKDELVWHSKWRGQVVVVESTDQMASIVNAIRSVGYSEWINMSKQTKETGQ